MRSPFSLVVHHAREKSRAHTGCPRIGQGAAPVAGVLRRYHAACRPNPSIGRPHDRPVTESLQKHDTEAVELTERDGKIGRANTRCTLGADFGLPWTIAEVRWKPPLAVVHYSMLTGAPVFKDWVAASAMS